MPHVKRIALFGPESTGKSTLAAELADYFRAPVAPEYVREFWDRHGGVIVAGDLDEIARGQIAGEDAAVAAAASAVAAAAAGPGTMAAKTRGAAGERGGELVICDTELLTNVLWADLLFPGHCPAWVRAEADRRCQEYALYLFCDTDLPWEPDPQRCFPDEAGRAMCRRLWLETLQARGLTFASIQGDRAQRLRHAIDAVEGVLRR